MQFAHPYVRFMADVLQCVSSTSDDIDDAIWSSLWCQLQKGRNCYWMSIIGHQLCQTWMKAVTCIFLLYITYEAHHILWYHGTMDWGGLMGMNLKKTTALSFLVEDICPIWSPIWSTTVTVMYPKCVRIITQTEAVVGLLYWGCISHQRSLMHIRWSTMASDCWWDSCSKFL